MPYVRRWPTTSATLGVLALLLGFAAADTAWLQPYGLAIDVAIADDLRSSVLTPLMLGISFLASPAVAVATVLLWTGLLVVWRRRPVAAVSTALVVAVGWGAALVVKARRRTRTSADRHRPLARAGDRSDQLPQRPCGVHRVRGRRGVVPRPRYGTSASRRGRRCRRRGARGGVTSLPRGALPRATSSGSVLVAGAAIVLLTGLWHRYLRGALLSAPAFAPVLARFATSAAGRAERVEPGR